MKLTESTAKGKDFFYLRLNYPALLQGCQKVLKQTAELLYFYFISFAKKKTNKQTERTLAGTPQQLWPITVGPGK